MQLIDEENDLALALAHFLKDGFQTLLKLATVLGACDKGTHIQCEDLFIFQSLRDIPADDSLCQSLDRRRLADARLTDQNRVVFCLSGKNTDHIADLRVPADDRIQLLAACLLDQILSVFIQCIIGSFRIVRRHALIAADGRKGLQKALLRDTKFLEELLHGRTLIVQNGQEQMLNGNILVSHLLCHILSADERLVQILSDIRTAAAYLYFSIQCLIQTVLKILLLDLHLLNQLCNQAVFLMKQGVEQMLFLDLLMSKLISNLFQIIHCFDGFLRKFADVHKRTSHLCPSSRAFLHQTYPSTDIYKNFRHRSHTGSPYTDRQTGFFIGRIILFYSDYNTCC